MEQKKPTTGRRGPMGGPRMGGTPEKAKDLKKTLKNIFAYVKPYWIHLIFVVIFAVVSTIFTIASPKILGNMTDEIVKGIMLRKGINFSNIANIGLWLTALYIISAVFSYLQSWIMTTISQNVTYELRRSIFTKISRLPLNYFDQHENGDIISRVTNDVEIVSQNLNQSLTQIITAVITIVGILCMMVSISWQMTFIAILVLPVSMIFIRLVVVRSQKFYDKQQESLGAIDTHVDEMFSNHLIVKTFCGEKDSVDKFNKVNQRLYESSWKAQFLSGLMMPIMQFISNLGYVGVAIVGGWLAINSKLSVGDIQAFIQYMNQFTQPISQTANITNIIQATAAAAERVFEFLDEREEPAEINTLELPKMVKGEVVFNDISFGYNHKQKIIKDFSIHIKPKQNIAIVGPTGAGKTTVVNLLMRFYDLDSGQISIDGIDIKDLKRKDVRSLFGMVLQDTWLFYGTIAENIAYGKPNASKNEIIAAAKSAHIDHFINTLPNGYKTIIGDGNDNISTGEKQLITIARAILAGAPMLILDEATSSVDTRTEALIQSAMDKLSHDRTSFVIAHRLSTIKNADMILIMRDGNIVEHGTHSELIDAKGYYFNLYNSQFSQD